MMTGEAGRVGIWDLGRARASVSVAGCLVLSCLARESCRQQACLAHVIWAFVVGSGGGV